MTNIKNHLRIISILISSALLFFACNQSTEKKEVSVSQEFTTYVTGFTSGIISNSSTIQVKLQHDVSEEIQTEAVKKSLFTLSPKVKGQTIWIDNQTIGFKPEVPLLSNTIYKAKFELGNIVTVPGNLQTLEFQFKVKKQDLSVNIAEIQTYRPDDLSKQKLTGRIITADYANPSDIEEILEAKQDNQELSIQWEHPKNQLEHAFTIDSVKRTKQKEEVIISWDASKINVDEKNSLKVLIPSLDEFKVMGVRHQSGKETEITILFSDPLMEDQDLRGLVFLDNNVDLKFSIEGNIIKAYTPSRLEATELKLFVHGVRNSMGYMLKKQFQKTLVFYNLKPELKLIGDGIILPGSQNLSFPFKAVNLSAVNVKIIRIYENSLPQFFQVNQYDGNNEINRVGRIVYKNTIPLIADKKIDYSKWNNFSLDLSSLFKTEPGAMYRVILSFGKDQSLYPCDEENDEADTDKLAYSESPDRSFDEDHYYNDRDYDYYDGDYNWRERDNPCHDTYYMYGNNMVARNVLASNIGIISKGSDGSNYKVIVTDLRTTEAIPDAEIQFYNYQNQLLSTGKTNSDGFLSINLDKKPYLIIAQKDNEKGYLRLDDGSSLSLSMFDISGNKAKKGVKGFIYGDRGIWRPGDSIFVSFILEDKNKVIPKNHPVIFELFTPENILYQKKINSSSVNNIYDFRTLTSPEVKTGNWLAKITVGGSSFTKTLKIETVKPNRLKINFDFKDPILKSNSNTNANLEVKWLHGAIAKNLKTDIKFTLSEGKTQFDKFKDYNFDDPTRNFTSEEQTLFDGKINDQGIATIPLKFGNIKNAPGMLNASFNLRAFENSGDFSIDKVTMPFSPYSSYVGLKVPKGKGWNDALYSNEPNLIPIATVDENGNPIDVQRVEIKIYELHWRWWWERSNGDDLARYASSPSTNLIKTDYVNTINGKALYEMNLGKESWGRKLIKVTNPISKHCAGQVFYTSYKGWWNNSGQGNSSGAEMLSFSTDKEKYNVGDKVTVEIPASQNGKALVSLESGSKVVDMFWVEMTESQKTFSFTATTEMAPNVFIHLSFIQAHNELKNDLPIRLYGIQNIQVEDPQTHLQPVIKMQETIRPEEIVRIQVKEKSGQKMAFTLAVVDEGLLDLTRFKTPNPWYTFYSREVLGIKTWDLYKYVMGAFTGKMAGLLALGGDEAIINKGGKKANRFKPVVKFFGPYELEESKTKTIEFIMPNYIGSVKTMVVAANNGAYGSAEKVTPVKKPLMVLGTLPRVLSPSEKVKLPITVFALDEKIKNATVEVSTNKLFKISGSNKQQISFSEIGDKLVYFDLEVLENIGIGKVNIEVKSGSEKASYQIEMNVRLPNPPVTNISDGMIEAGKSLQLDYNPIGVKGTNSVTLEVSSIPPLNLENRLSYLINYPHGCIEQTTSSVFPQLHLDKLVTLSEYQKSEIEKNIKSGIQKIKNFQLSNGGLSYWPGYYNEANEWGTSYAGHFMLEAKEKGYSLPVGFLKNWKEFQKQKANNWSYDERSTTHFKESTQLNQAYRLYTLALAGDPVYGAMNRMKELPDLSSSASWRLAAAYKLAGRSDVAEMMINNLKTEVKSYKELSGTYGSAERDQAMILETLVMLGKQEDAKVVMDELANKMSSENWYSTQTTSYILLAVTKFMGTSSVGQGLNYKLDINNNISEVTDTKSLNQFDLKADASVPGKIKITNTNDKILFVKFIQKGVPLTNNSIDAESNIQLSVNYLDMEGNIIQPNKIVQGSDFMVEVKVHHPGFRADYEELALSQIFPSGWEIKNPRMTAGPIVQEVDKPKYLDVKDDRVYSYFDLKKNETKTFRILLNASYPGKYYLPTVYCEAMYDNTINARKAGQWVEVTEK